MISIQGSSVGPVDLPTKICRSIFEIVRGSFSPRIYSVRSKVPRLTIFGLQYSRLETRENRIANFTTGSELVLFCALLMLCV
jgi:hypothetical protein